MRNLSYAMVMIPLILSFHVHAADKQLKDLTLQIGDRSSCIKVSERLFFSLDKGEVTISYLKRDPKLVTISYLASADYQPMPNRIDLLTIREQTQDVASTYFEKASVELNKLAEKNSENQIVQTSEKDISCGVTGASPGLANAKTVMCYLRTESGTHTFSTPIVGDPSFKTNNVYLKAFARKPCSNVIHLEATSKRLPATIK